LGEAVDLLLAQGCLRYQRLYLYPELLPRSLDGFSTLADYVAELRLTDPFTSLFAASVFQDAVQPALTGARATIGLRLGILGGAETVSDSGPLTVTEVLPFTRAWYDGLQAEDRIVAVHRPPGVVHASVQGLTLDQALELLPREEAEEAEITVDRGGRLVVVATAAEVHLAFLLQPDVAYFSVRRYTTQTGQRVRDDYLALSQEAGAAPGKIILDLRGNGGGSVTGALELTDYLVDNDEPPNTHPILTFDGTLFQNTSRYLGGFAANLSGVAPENFVVLVDGATASASEVTAAALRDYGVATLVGTATFGKGVRQDAVTLLDGSGLFITSHFILPPSGVSYHGIGIDPDLLVEATVAEGTITQAQDPQLEAAVALLLGSTPVSQAQRARRVPRTPTEDPWSRFLGTQ
jgi:carboxyl-terminal processing protease